MRALNKKILSDSINKIVFAIAKDSSINIYLVGGYIRDLFLGIAKADKDYVIEGHGAWDFAKGLAGVLEGSFVGLDKERDIARIVTEDRTLDFSGTRGKLIEEDLGRRDFTINSVAWSPERGFIDPLNGISDIKERVLRAIRKENMVEDPLRLLRAYRIGAELKMDIESETIKIITELSQLLKDVSGERVSSELFLLLKSPQSFNYLSKASGTGIIDAIFPELAATRDIPPHGNHHLGTFEHSLEVVRKIEILLAELPEWVISHLQEEVSSGVNRFTVLKLGGLLHDIGKPLTLKINDEGRYTFMEHERAGAGLIENISGRIKLSKKITEILKSLVKWHLRPLHLIKNGNLESRPLYRFFLDTGEECIDITLLAIADILSMKRKEDEIADKESLLTKILEGVRYFKEKESETQKILKANDIMEIFKIRPGPEVGNILKIIREAQILGEVRSREQAIEYINKVKGII